MSLSILGTGEMLTISERWIKKPGRLPDGKSIVTARPFLEKIPIVKAMLPFLEKTHYNLEHLYRKEKLLPPTLFTVRKQQRELDQRHDNLVRALFYTLNAFSSLESESEEATKLLALREKLFPEELSVVRWSYREEARAATKLEVRLSEEDKTLLNNISISYKGFSSFSLLALTEELIKKGKELGSLEDKKEKILQEIQQAKTPITEKDLRNRWIRCATGLQQNLELAEVDQSIKKQILGLLQNFLSNALNKEKSEKEEFSPSASNQTVKELKND